MEVLKFGGTSIRDAILIKSVSNIVNNKKYKIIVFSAISGITNLLSEFVQQSSSKNNNTKMEIIRSIEEVHFNIINALFTSINFKIIAYKKLKSVIEFINNSGTLKMTDSTKNTILAQGELLSAMIIYLYFLEQNIDVAYIPALNFMRLNKNREPDYNYIQSKLNKELHKHHGCYLFITNGFVCKNHSNETDNLGRGGSDYSASIIGSVLRAKKIEIWTDVDGLRNNDPSCVQYTSPISHLSYNEASELAYFGAKILHPSSIKPAQKSNIPLVLKNTYNPMYPGTFISEHTKLLGIKGISAKDHITTIRIISARMMHAYGFLSKIFGVFEKYKTPVDMLTTSEISVAMTIENTESLSEIEAELSAIGEVSIETKQSIICLVGNFHNSRTEAIRSIFEAIESVPVRMISFGASDINISFTVDMCNKVKTLNLLNEHILKKQACLALN